MAEFDEFEDPIHDDNKHIYTDTPVESPEAFDAAGMVFALQQSSHFVRENTTVDEYLANADKIYDHVFRK